MHNRKLLMISTDRKIFEEGSAVRLRQAEYSKDWNEVHIIVFDRAGRGNSKTKVQDQNGKTEPITSGSETVIAPNCWAYSTRSRSKLLYPFDAMRLGRFIIEKRGITDITCQDASLTAMAGSSLKKQFNIPLEIQVHEDIGSPYYPHGLMRRIRKSMALSYLPKADKIRVVSSRIKDYLVGTIGIDASKIEVRPIKVDVEMIKRAPVLPGADLHKKYPQFEKIVLIAARLEKEKNVALAIRAWPEVLRKIPKAGLIIVGSGSQLSNLPPFASLPPSPLLRRKLRKSTARLWRASQWGKQSPISNLPSLSIIFEDWVDRDTLISYYKSCDQFLVTSLFEGYGMTLVEAKAAGCKIVSTDVGVAREVDAKIVGWNEADVARGVIEALSKD